MNDVLDGIAGCLIFLAVPPATLFPFMYGTRSAWWIHPIGRALFTKAVGLGLLIDLAALYAVFGDDYPGRQVVRVICYALVVAGLYYQTYVLLTIQHRARKDPRRGKPL